MAMYQQVSAMHEEQLTGPALFVVWAVAIGLSVGIVLGVVALGLSAYRWVMA
jgi:hypothetical protein